MPTRQDVPFSAAPLRALGRVHNDGQGFNTREGEVVIEVKVLEGLYCFFWVCDVCHRPIEEAGNFYYEVHGVEPTGRQWATHKHPCSEVDRAIQKVCPVDDCHIFFEELDVPCGTWRTTAAWTPGRPTRSSISHRRETLRP